MDQCSGEQCRLAVAVYISSGFSLSETSDNYHYGIGWIGDGLSVKYSILDIKVQSYIIDPDQDLYYR